MIGFVFLSLMAGEAWFAHQKASEQAIATVDGSPLPETALILGDSDKIENLSQHKGNVLLINFWATWCDACIEEMPSISRLHSTFKDKGFEVISINVDEKPYEQIKSKVEEMGILFPVYRDKEEALARAFNIVAIPFNIVVRRNFTVAWKESGERDWASAQIINRIQELLSEPI